MKIELEDEDDLDHYIICHKCHTLHKEITISHGSKALCSVCNMTLYKHDDRLVEHGLALSITGLIFFVLANIFPLVKIEILGNESYITIVSMISTLVGSGHYLVALFLLYLIVIFPAIIFLFNILLFSLMKLGRGEGVVKNILVLLAQIEPWHMSDIFLVSILVSIVKLFGMASIHIGVSFWTLFVFVLINVYMTRSIHMGELWGLKQKIYGNDSEKAGSKRVADDTLASNPDEELVASKEAIS